MTLSREYSSQGVLLVQTVTLTAYGLATLVHPAGWRDKPVYDFLDYLQPDKLWIASLIILAVAALTGAALVTHLTILRIAAGLLALLHWTAFAWGGFTHDGTAYVPVMYACAGFGSAVALCRA